MKWVLGGIIALLIVIGVISSAQSRRAEQEKKECVMERHRAGQIDERQAR